MRKSIKFLLVGIMIMVATAINAQVTTSALSGKITDNSDAIIGATVTAKHVPSGTVYRAVTNTSGVFSIQSMKAGGPYTVEISYVGYETTVYKDINLTLGQTTVLDTKLSEGSNLMQEVVVSGSRTGSMSTSRAGALTSISAAQISNIPTVSRSMNDLLKMTPQGGNTGNGFAVGGGNYRQSYVTVDGAAFNNAFGIGENLPANGSPISIEALDQISVSVTPFDVRQSGFTGGAISAVTKSGTNEFKGSAYIYTTNVHLRGNKVNDTELTRTASHTTTYGLTLGGPIIKDKLFFFVNGEYEPEVSAGPTGYAGTSSTGSLYSDGWATSGQLHRPTVEQMNTISSYLKSTYGYDPGRYQGYNLETPSYKVLARLDWNINDDNKINVRFSTTHTKDSNSPSSSTSPMSHSKIYSGGRYTSGRTTNYALYFESARYYQERNFTSVAGEWNSKWHAKDVTIDNMLRLTYSYQDEPRSYEGNQFPTVDILEDGGCYTTFGVDPFTEGNLRQVKTFVVTDEVSATLGKNNLMAGLQFETNKATNGYAQCANGYYVYSSWEDFVNGNAPAAYGITFPTDGGDQFLAEMKYNQLSFYVQDQINFSERLRVTAGLRFETAMYPDLDNNYNDAFADLVFRNGNQYSTDQVPDTKLTMSPRVGFNWDILGDRKYVLRGGSGYFIGRLPFVWLVSAVGNSGVGQYTYSYTDASSATYQMDKFLTSASDQVAYLKEQGLSASSSAPSAPTIIDTDLKMTAMWKTTLAFDAKLPWDIDFSIEGIYGKEYNSAVVTNESRDVDQSSPLITLNSNDTRKSYSKLSSAGSTECYYITNADKNKAYYLSLTASLSKKFDFGLDLSASYTYSRSKSYGDGIGDQVSSAYYTNRFSVNGINDQELGYGTYVSPHRLLVSASFYKEYGKHFATRVGLIYEGMNMGYTSSGYAYTRYSYTFDDNIVGDYGAENLLYIPASRDELDSWEFAESTYYDSDGNEQTYTADMQRDDFWAYINQDSYLKSRKGKYTQRGGATMPWHSQLDFKFEQSFFLNVCGKRNTLLFGIDIKNLPNLLNSKWGLYKVVNNTTLLGYDDGVYTFNTNGNYRLTDTYTDYESFNSTYSIQFSVKYIFN